MTGAASGIGRAIAIAFARDGCSNLGLGDLNLAGLEETKSIIQSQYPKTEVELKTMDVGDDSSTDKFFQTVVDRFGRIDFGVNVAGYAGKLAPVHEMSEEEFTKYYVVNQRGVFFCERALLRQMLKQQPLDGYECRGSIVNITSLSATAPLNNLAAYSASKGGALGLSKVDALDYGPDRIRVNVVAPGNTETPMLKKAAGDEGLKVLAAATPFGRNARPEDIANAVVWLSGPNAAFITGITLPVDGGFSLATGP